MHVRFQHVRPLFLCTAVAFLVYSSAGLWVAAHSSATSDEVPHIGAGVRYLQGDLRLNREHPPLIKLLAASMLPARSFQLQLPPGSPSEQQWLFGSAVLHRPGERPLELLLRARAPVLALNALCLLWLVFWAARAFGDAAACYAACLWATCPLWLAHASLVTTDAAASTFLFASAASGAALVEAEPVRARWFWSASLTVCLALGLASKYSSLLALGLIPGALALDAWRMDARAAIGWGLGAAAVGGALGVTLAWGWPPDPLAYLHGVQLVGHNHTQGYVFYAFGAFFRDADPLYFGRALLVKAALGTVVLCGAGLLFWFLDRRAGGMGTGPRQARWLMVLPPLGYYAVIALEAPPIGVRYVLPVLPFLILAAGRAAARWAASQRARLLLWPLAAAQLLGFATALRTSPIAYFNGLTCFTGDLPPCLDDSNVDWGQALPQLESLHKRRYPDQALRLFYFGSSPPAAYVPSALIAQPLELLQPMAAVYVVSAHLFARVPEASWLHKRAPDEIVAGSYAVYDLRTGVER